MNLVLVIFDSARRDRFGCYGYARPTTPAVDALAREGLTFEQMITPGPWTVPSHGSLFTGLYPREHGGEWPTPLVRKDCVRLAEFLSEHGYDTACLTANPLLTRSGLNQGFRIMQARKDLDGSAMSRRARFALGRHDSGSGAIARRAARLLAGELRPPFFLAINFMECHWPYFPPLRYQRRFLSPSGLWLSRVWRRTRERDLEAWEAIATADEAQLSVLRDTYDAALATADDRFGMVMEALRRSGGLDQTIVIAAADHGENIGDHGMATHQGSLHRTLIHVPFVARIPGRGPGRVEGLTQMTDVFVGVCRLLSLEPPESLRDRPMSQDPFAISDQDSGRPYAFAEWRRWGPAHLDGMRRAAPHFDFEQIPDGLECAQDRRFKLIVRRDTDEAVLFDLVADPHEQTDVSSVHPAEVSRLRFALDLWRDQFPPIGAQTQTTYTREEVAAVEARLRELGYM